MERRRGALAVLILLAVAVVLPVVHIAVYPRISPIDEESHIDYTLRAPGLVPTRSGDLWLQQTMREEACRGKDRGVAPDPSCTQRYRNPRTFGLGGYPSAYVHPPTYYDVTAVLGRGIQHVLGLRSPVTGFRLVGVLWLAGGLLACYGACRGFGAARAPTVAVLVALAASPGVFYPAGIVNPDAASLLVGGLVVGLVHRWDRDTGRDTGGARALLLVAAGVISTAVKVQNGLVAVLMALYLLLAAVWPLGRWLTGGRRGPAPTDRLGRRVGGVLVLGLSAAVVAIGWTVVVRATATLPPADQPMARQFTVADLPPGSMAAVVGRFTEPLSDQYVPAQYTSGWLTAGTLVLTWLFVATLVWPAVFGSAGARLRVFAWAVLAVGTLGPVLETYANLVLLHQFIPDLSTRYALPIVPAFAVAAALAARTRGQRRGYALVAAASLVTTLLVVGTSRGPS